MSFFFFFFFERGGRGGERGEMWMHFFLLMGFSLMDGMERGGDCGREGGEENGKNGGGVFLRGRRIYRRRIRERQARG